ncbi:MAG: hypothetical protein Q9188_005790 [Gyalolechia gomerana]
MDTVNNDDRTPSIYGGSISLIIIVNIAIAARLYARKISNVHLWWDDFIILVALIFDWGISVGIWLDIKHAGFGRHSVAVGGPVSEEEFSTFFKWDKSIKGGTCINQDKFYRLNGIANLLIDFMLWSLTLPVVWRLNLNFRQKLSVSGIFLLGLLACVASIIRVATFSQVREKDSTYTLVNVILWSAIEQSTGIVCACLPTTRPLLGRLLTKMKRSDKSSDGTPQIHPNGIALTSYHSRRNNIPGSLDTSKSGFARLDERIIDGGTITVTTDISKTLSDGPLRPPRILKQQTFEQHVDDGRWFSGPV